MLLVRVLLGALQADLIEEVEAPDTPLAEADGSEPKPGGTGSVDAKPAEHEEVVNGLDNATFTDAAAVMAGEDHPQTSTVRALAGADVWMPLIHGHLNDDLACSWPFLYKAYLLHMSPQGWI